MTRGLALRSGLAPDGKPVHTRMRGSCPGLYQGYRGHGLFTGRHSSGKPILAWARQWCDPEGTFQQDERYLGLVTGTKNGMPVIASWCEKCKIEAGYYASDTASGYGSSGSSYGGGGSNLPDPDTGDPGGGGGDGDTFCCRCAKFDTVPLPGALTASFSTSCAPSSRVVTLAGSGTCGTAIYNGTDGYPGDSPSGTLTTIPDPNLCVTVPVGGGVITLPNEWFITVEVRCTACLTTGKPLWWAIFTWYDGYVAPRSIVGGSVALEVISCSPLHLRYEGIVICSESNGIKFDCCTGLQTSVTFPSPGVCIRPVTDVTRCVGSTAILDITE